MTSTNSNHTNASRLCASRAVGLWVITAIYVIAIGIAVGVFAALPDWNVFARILVADIVATVFVWLAGVGLRNTSVYDPYWSVAPIAVVVGLALEAGRWSTVTLLLLVAVGFWGVRLTLNWAHTFVNLGTQDWRYDHFRARFPRTYQLISLAGINLFPTVIVFGVLTPVIALLIRPDDAASAGWTRCGVNWLTLMGFAVSLGAATLQLVADRQMHAFRAKHAGQGLLIRTGVWQYARHPNYLGEIAMWWGVWVMLVSIESRLWWLGVGALANTLMFLIVSIPLADRRNRTTRTGFAEYAAETNALIPLPIGRAKRTQ